MKMKSKTTRRISRLAGIACAVILMLAMGITALATAETGSTIYVKGDSTNIRSGASTDSEVVGQLNANAPLTVLGITSGSDGRNWYQVECVINGETKTGYIREDLVEIPNVQDNPTVPEDQGGETYDEGESNVSGGGDVAPDPGLNGIDDLTALEPDGVPGNLPAGFEDAYVRVNGLETPAWTDSATGTYYIFYAMTQTGTTGWYIFDKVRNQCIRYADFMGGTPAAGESVSSNGGGVSGTAFGIVVVICVLLVAATLFMGIKLMNAGGRDDDYDDDDYDDDDYDDDDDDYDDDDDEYEDVRDNRRVSERETHNVVVQQRHFTQPQQRPVSQGQARPAGQPGAGQPRPAGQARPAGQQSPAGQVRPAGQQRPAGQSGQTGQGQQRYAQRQAGQQRYVQRTTQRHDDEY